MNVIQFSEVESESRRSHKFEYSEIGARQAESLPLVAADSSGKVFSLLQGLIRSGPSTGSVSRNFRRACTSADLLATLQGRAGWRETWLLFAYIHVIRAIFFRWQETDVQQQTKLTESIQHLQNERVVSHQFVTVSKNEYYTQHARARLDDVNTFHSTFVLCWWYFLFVF